MNSELKSNAEQNKDEPITFGQAVVTLNYMN